jgi:hypothetical protein
MIPDEIVVAILREFAPRFEVPLEEWLSEQEALEEETVVVMEDLFYCVHNAARSAMLGDGSCVPEDFHPVHSGRVIQIRRQALTWALSPGVAWDDTDLST